MNVIFTKESFKQIFETNLKDLWERTWLYKLYYFFRYSLIHFINNLWVFRGVLWRFRWWSHHYTLDILKRSLELMSSGLERYGNEVEESRNKKISKINRSIELLNSIIEEDYIDRAELELGETSDTPFDTKELENGSYQLIDKRTDKEKEHDSKVYDFARELEQSEWNELWDIFRGQDLLEYKYIQEKSTEEEKKELDLYYKWFDGSDMRGWWN